MRRWTGRGIWLAAWTVCAWLGFRLNIELPRDPGTPLCQVTDNSEERLGFLPDPEAIDTRRIKAERRYLLGTKGEAVTATIMQIRNRDVGAARSVTTERWELTTGARRWEPTTCAVRLADGRLSWRTWTAEPVRFTSNGALWLDYEHNVYTIPRPNYPLLTLCQAILALPLILLWSNLRWHRNRRLRMAGVQV